VKRAALGMTSPHVPLVLPLPLRIRSLFRQLLVGEILLAACPRFSSRLGRKLSGTERAQMVDSLIRSLELDHTRSKSLSQLSHGARLTADLARCVISAPKVVVIDDLFATWGPAYAESAGYLLREFARQRGIAFLMALARSTSDCLCSTFHRPMT
jgi:ABC-type lipopolysaccharide export system ATPase subunit